MYDCRGEVDGELGVLFRVAQLIAERRFEPDELGSAELVELCLVEAGGAEHLGDVTES